ncbi:hypothetical protein LCGC14_1267030 [marine sediment metagenome]|uniref:Uncharacterized protein n=1 Tax=marine sediment metagenome TaxID=412755 RepID=A0A0F9KZ82_9ZZZZ
MKSKEDIENIKREIENVEKRNPLRKLIGIIEDLNERKIIYNLSITSSGMNDPVDYTRVSFNIPKK